MADQKRPTLEEALETIDKEQRIRKLLEYLLGAKKVDWWLNQPHPELDNRTPQSVMDEYGDIGKDCLLDMLIALATWQSS